MNDSIAVRDYLAGQALTGILANPNGPPENPVRSAYIFADVALAEREQTKPLAPSSATEPSPIPVPGVRRVIPFITETQYATVAGGSCIPEPMLAARTFNPCGSFSLNRQKAILEIDMLFDARMRDCDALEFCRSRFWADNSYGMTQHDMRFVRRPDSQVAHLVGTFTFMKLKLR